MDYVLEDRTHANWPGLPTYKGRGSKRGYKTREEAATGVVVDRSLGTVSELVRRIRTSDGMTLEVETQNLEAISANNPAWSKVFG